MFFQDALIRVPVDFTKFLSHVLPPIVCYFIFAVLTVTPQTRTVRIAFWPVIALLALRTVVTIDMSSGRPERRFLNTDLMLFMFSIATRSLEWTLAKGPLVRHLRPTNSSPSAIMDALDLIFNLRGHGWEWSRGSYIPRETRPTHRNAFVLWTLLSAVAHALLVSALHRAILTLAPVGVGPVPEGSSIFDDTLSFYVRYFRASIITIWTAFGIYAVLQMTYDFTTIPAILLLGQDPAQWPPAFDAPWRATSLNDFWSHRWHQWFRPTFLFIGGYPLSLVLGRSGTVLGGFLSSAVFHYLALQPLHGHGEFWRMFIGFGMMVPGILVERAFYQWTGRKVGGIVGWVWTMAWLVLWGSVIVEGFARAGMFDSSSNIDNTWPVRMSVEQWVIDFDAWLHTI